MSDDHSHVNGELKCGAVMDLRVQKQSFEALTTELASMLEVLKEDQNHLASISNTLGDIRNDLLSTLLGKEIVPISIVKSMIEEQRKSYTSIIKIICWVFSSIIIVLAGLKFLAPHLFQ